VRIFCFVGLLWMLAGPVWAQHSPADTLRVTLTEVITSALRASPQMDQRQAQRRFAAARRDRAEASRFLTDVSINTAHSVAPGIKNIPAGTPEDELHLDPGVENDFSIGELRPFNRLEIALRQPLFTWGELSGNVEAAGHGVAVEEARMEEKAAEVAVRTGELYFNLLLTRALSRLTNRGEEALQRAKKEVNRLLEEGDEGVDEADRFKLRLTEQEFRRRVTQIKQNRRTARSALHRQLLLPEGTTVVPATDALQSLDFSIHPDSLAYYLTVGLNNRPEVEQAEAGVKARKALVDVEQSNYYPKIGLQLSLAQSFTFPERPNPDNPFVGDAFSGTDTRSGLGIQQNLNFGQTRAQVEQAKAELSEVKHQRTAARQLVRFEVENAYRNLLVAKADVDSRDEATTISGEWLRTEQIDFDLGFGDAETLVEAVQADLEQKAGQFEAIKRYNVAILNLLRSTGTLADRARAGTLVDSTTTEK